MTDQEPKVNPNEVWQVSKIERLSACDNRPGLKKIYVRVVDGRNVPVPGVKVRFDTEPSKGIAYDHADIWGITDEDGYLEWDHFGVPTRYRLWMEDDEYPLIEDIRTDLGNEYCSAGILTGGWRPVNRPGVYSYRIEIRRGGWLPEFEPPVVSNVRIEVSDDQAKEGYARVSVSFATNVETEAQVHYALFFEGAGPDQQLQPVCDPFGMWRSGVSGPGLAHTVELSGGSLWYSREVSKRYCLVVSAWEPGYRGQKWARGYSDVLTFTLPGA